MGRRQEHLFTSTRAILESGAALELRIDSRHHVTVSAGDGIHAVATIGGIQVHLGELATNGATAVEILTAPPTGPEGTPEHGPDLVVVHAHLNNEWQEVGRIDGRYFSTEVAGGFTGRFIGISTQEQQALFSDFVYRGSDDYELLLSALPTES
ncbi:hypothetical protein [Paenarthrobacter sp. AB444]|uniref:beta-xylosidase family glycoside hydrolase n=1 Tax=Paenarthrobacter sp. AB444 TaxID=3025681 RepID=UPI00236652BF|nr:hypothetical protein [Paenarthrobacter sp. AB444]MDD7833903.1 hypothetical protein [Paenarthrobacter sp. AB444]